MLRLYRFFSGGVPILDPGVKLGTPTPRADPSGDYAFEVFRKADAIRPGARLNLPDFWRLVQTQQFAEFIVSSEG